MRLNRLSLCAVLVLLAAGTACSGTTDADAEETGSPIGGSTTGSFWERNDGVAAWVSLQGTVAKLCDAAGEVVGTYNASAPSMTFVVAGDAHTFPLEFRDDALLVGVPNQGINTNTATWYVRSNQYPCDGSGTGGDGGGTNQSNVPPLGTISIRLMAPTGSCVGGPKPYEGHVTFMVWDEGRERLAPVTPIMPPTTGGATHWDFSFPDAHEASWTFFPSYRSGHTYPPSCVLEGKVTISTRGETRNITLP